MNRQASLFATEHAPLLPSIQKAARGFQLRDYQLEDADEVCKQWALGNRSVLCVHATGLGKSVMGAELAGRKPAGTRALIVVDSTDLTGDLYRTVKHHLGIKPGVVTGDYTENLGSEVLVATKQSLCSGDWYRTLDMSEFWCVIVDECESALAAQYLVMISYFQEKNPQINLLGMTATPLPAGNRKITDLFKYAAREPGLLYRDLQWAYLNGWLVQPRQGLLACSLDYHSLKIRKREDGEVDFSDKDIARLMADQTERQWVELAGGIYQIAKGHTAVVICPNSTAIADHLAGYIEGHARAHDERNIAFSIHRGLGRKKSSDLMRKFKSGAFPIAVSCRMFEKGFDYDAVTMVIMLRRTKSLRLYTQIAGRATRPLLEIRKRLGDYPNANSRRRLIYQSRKPSCVIVDCVGIDDEAKDILSVIDILGRGIHDDTKERVRRLMLDRYRAQQELDSQTFEETERDPEEGQDVGDLAREAQRLRQEEMEREREKRAHVSGDVDVTYEVGDVRPGSKIRGVTLKVLRGDITDKQLALLIALGVGWDTAMAYSRKQAGLMITVYKNRGTVPNWNRVRAFERKHGKLK